MFDSLAQPTLTLLRMWYAVAHLVCFNAYSRLANQRISDLYANIAVEKASVYSLKIGIPSIHEFLIHNYFYVHLILIPDKEVSHTHTQLLLAVSYVNCIGQC